MGVVGIVALTAYLIGSIPFGYLVARACGVDIFAHGSGNIGATNVGRVLGRPYGVLVFVLDFIKGAVPTLLAKWITHMPGIYDGVLERDALAVIAGSAAFLGHLYPIYLRLHGGKGVATGAGVVSVLVPLPALGALGVWLLVLAVTRYVSLASMLAALTICVLRLIRTPEPFAPQPRVLTAFCIAAAALIVFRHRANIIRLLQGTEPRLGHREAAGEQVSTKPS
jgi:acyl-phosphate glycerol 3-phosphate acyltransferase